MSPYRDVCTVFPRVQTSIHLTVTYMNLPGISCFDGDIIARWFAAINLHPQPPPIQTFSPTVDAMLGIDNGTGRISFLYRQPDGAQIPTCVEHIRPVANVNSR